MVTIDNFNFTNKRVLIRVDFNVPLNKETHLIQDDTRLKSSLKSINKVIDGGGSVILMSHLGRPKSGPDEKYSLSHIVKHLSKLLNKQILFVNDCISEKSFELTANLQPGNIVLLENLRFHPNEKSGSKDFAKLLSQHGDVYINDAFGTAHRAHASTTVIANYFTKDNKMFGYLIEKEIQSVSQVLESGQKPVIAIVGGAKVSSKITILENLFEKIDQLLIGGGMTYTFVKAMGGKIGNSLVEDDYLEMATNIIKKAKKENVEIIFPVDSLVADEFSDNANKKVTQSNEIPDGFMGLDIGPKAIEDFTNAILKSKTILWNGPVGVFEMSSYSKGSKAVAEAIVEATEKGAFSLIGGGDSVAAINQFNLADKVSHVSTGGGAMLEYLEGKELPGIKAIKKGSC